MGSLFRSEEMSLIQLFIQYEAAHATVNEIGELGLVQFRDLNEQVNAFQRNFVDEIKRRDEMERKIRFLSAHVEKIGLTVPEAELTYSRSRTQQEIDDLDNTLKNLEQEIIQLTKNEEDLNKHHLQLLETQCVLQEVNSFLLGTESSQGFAIPVAAMGDDASIYEGNDIDLLHAQANVNIPEGRLSFVTGVINRDKRIIFERVLWRTLRGNLYMNQAEIEEPINDPITGEVTSKNVFIIFCQGEQLRSKVKKVCEAFGAKLYPCPETAEARRTLSQQVNERISDVSNVLAKTAEHRRRVLSGLAENLSLWSVTIRKEKAIYHTMNLFNVDVTSKCFIAEGWCPTADIPKIRDALRVATDQTQTVVSSVLNVVHTRMEPPTFNRTNKFTAGFQTIIDAYGVGKYREVNPTPFAVITFPFLFAVMFGDIGHGFLMALAAFFLVYNEKKFEKQKNDEMFNTFFGGRYIILLMGLFSIYTGFVYNDLFSKGLPIFKTGWEFHSTGINGSYVGEFTGAVYPFGIDYSWHGSDNMLIFSNSYKMKMSVIFGVIHMSFGIILSCFNHVFFKKRVSVYHEFVPQIIFLESIFGYLTFTIIYKWCNDWSTRNPPSLLNMLINMFLSPGNINPGEELYSGQSTVQVILLVLALVAVPWMLLVKPLWLRHKHKASASAYSHVVNTEDDNQALGGHDSEDEGHEEQEHEEFDFGEEMVHQVIHTIEFCLGCISNTASYLRLWALSLAHNQLSEVLWNMTLGQVINMGGFIGTIGLFGAFAVWFALTIGILLVMEGLSAFLHALRLHWVEFNQKFYAASGYAFIPFSFKRALSGEEE